MGECQITYEVLFKLYHYNSGNGRNGNYVHKESFLDETEATNFYKKLKHWLHTKKETSQFASNYCWDGYLVSVDGVYKVTKERLQIKDNP